MTDYDSMTIEELRKWETLTWLGKAATLDQEESEEWGKRCDDIRAAIARKEAEHD